MPRAILANNFLISHILLLFHSSKKTYEKWSSGYSFCMNKNILGAFQICIIVSFQQDISGRLLLILRKLDIHIFNSKHLNPNSNSNNSIRINIVSTLYLMSRNVDFLFIIMFSGLLFYSWVITRTMFSLKNLVYMRP